MKNKMKITLSFLLVLSFWSCNQKGSSSSEQPQTPPTRDDLGGDGQAKVCKTNRVINILKDKRSIVSQLSSNKNKLIVWDYSTQEKRTELSSFSSLMTLSSSGDYILKRVSPRKFQVNKTGENSTYSVDLNYRLGVKSLKFSRYSDYVISTLRKRGISERVEVYDILQRERVHRSDFVNVKYTHMLDDQNLIVIDGPHVRNKVTKINIATSDSEDFKIRSGTLRWYGLTKSVLLVKIDYRFYGYDLESGDYLYNRKLKAIYDYNPKTEQALVLLEDRKNVRLMNMVTGELSDPFVGPEDLYLDTCHFSIDPNKFLCRSRTQPGKVVVWNISDNSTENVCF